MRLHCVQGNDGVKSAQTAKIMAKYVNLYLTMDTTVVTHLLGGLATSYRNLREYPKIQVQIKSTINDILNDLHRQEVNLAVPAFKTYVQLINWQALNQK